MDECDRLNMYEYEQLNMYKSDRLRAERYEDIIEYTKRGMVDQVKMCIGCGADVNKKDYFDNYAVLAAVERSDMTILKLLVQAGAKLDVKSGGLSALVIARHNKNELMVNYIKEQLAIQAQCDIKLVPVLKN